MSKFTAGPWKAIPATDGFRAPGDGDYAIVNDSLICPCTVWGWTEGDANARLIAEAPALYTILKRIIGRATAPMSDGGIDLDDVAEARAAITRVEL